MTETFEDDYPEELIDRLKWFGEKLGLTISSANRILGTDFIGDDWESFVEKYPDLSDQLEELLVLYLDYFNDNISDARSYLEKVALKPEVIFDSLSSAAHDENVLRYILNHEVHRFFPAMTLLLVFDKVNK